MNSPAGPRPPRPSKRISPLNAAERAKALYEIKKLPEALEKRDVPAVITGLLALMSFIPGKANPFASGASLVGLNATLMAIGQDYQTNKALQPKNYLALTSAVLDVVSYFSGLLGAPQISAIAKGLSIATGFAAESETLNQILMDPYNADNPGYKALNKQLQSFADGQFIDDAFDTVGKWILPAPSTPVRAPARPTAKSPPSRPTTPRPARADMAHPARSARRPPVARPGPAAGQTNKATVLAAMHAAHIVDPTEQAMFLAQVDHESGGFKHLDESFKYRNAKQLMAVSASARKHGTAAVEAALARGPEAVAALMYGGWMGNKTAEDAYRYRGRGFIQLTGRDMYTNAGKALGLDLVKQPELAADPAVAARIATWFWQSRKGLAQAGRAGNVKVATRKINGGENGLKDRQDKFARYLREVQSGSAHTATAPPTVAAKPAGPKAVQRVPRRSAPSQPASTGRRTAPIPTVDVITTALGQLQTMLAQLDSKVQQLSAAQPHDAHSGNLAAAVNHANQLNARRS